MDYISRTFKLLIYILRIQINIFGFYITIENILLFALFGALFIWFLRRLFE